MSTFKKIISNLRDLNLHVTFKKTFAFKINEISFYYIPFFYFISCTIIVNLSVILNLKAMFLEAKIFSG